MKTIETFQKILYVLFYKFIKSIKDTISQLIKTENLIILFIFIVIIMAGIYTNIKQKIVIYSLSLLFLFLICYRIFKSKKVFWLHEYKVIKGINWKDKLKQWKEETKKEENKDD